MKIIDTHTHIYVKEYDSDIEDVIARAKSAGVEKVLTPNIDMETLDRMHALADKHPDFCLPMIGLHPTSVGNDWQEKLDVIRKFLKTRKYVGIGEIGMDLYWDKEQVVNQQHAFEEQLRLSIEYDLPVSIHSRDAIRPILRCIKNIGPDKLRGSFHCFGGNGADLRDILKYDNFLIGVGGVVTFQNSTLAKVLKETSLSKLLIETDAPFLAPYPYRGKRNEPAYNVCMVNKLAEVYGTTAEEVARITTENAKKLFNIQN